MQAKNKTIVVTGGGSGIGRELVLQLLERGAKIAAVDINEAALKETVKLAGDGGKNISVHVANLADKAAVEGLLLQITQKHQHVDAVINNAGIIQPFVKVNDLDYDAIERVMQVNFWGLLYMTKTFLPHLLERPEAHIVNVSSMGGFLPVPGQSIYGASKAAVKLLTEGLYAELADTSVDVTVVFPGAIATNISKNSGVMKEDEQETEDASSDFKPLPADEAARIIIDAMEKSKFRVCVGKDSRSMDKMYRMGPKFATKLITKKMKSLLS